MKISKVIRQLETIRVKFGNISVTGGRMMDDMNLGSITVTDTEGYEIYPCDPNGVAGVHQIDGVFFE